MFVRTTLLLLCVAFSKITAIAQPTMLYQQWRLVEIYQIDTSQNIVRQSDILAPLHRAQMSFHLAEMGIENQYLIFSRDSLVYQFDKRLDNTTKLHPPHKTHWQGKVLLFGDSSDHSTILQLTPSLLILGNNSTDIIVYVSADVDIAEMHLADDYIWEYIDRYFPRHFRRYEEGIWTK
jgi:hypothetical protein